ncbi:MAG: CoA transferase [Betaproteobacteria bacterium]|nr:CoA transferase [Betaproteobacteria bacterium]
MTDTNRKGPLSRFRVIDLTRLRSGPTCVRQLADWGADVIKIESPLALGVSDGWGDSRLGPDFQNLHRNKRSLTLNLKDPAGLEIFRKLADGADVVVENYRPEVKYRLGIDYETLRKTNPRLVYASVSGFGQDGPYAKRPGYDQIAQGMGGLMAITGFPGQGPVRVGIAVSDSAAGNYAAMGILTALLEREVSGEGQWVQVSLLESMIAMLDFQAARWLVAGEVPEQAGNDHPTSIPSGVFPTSDGYVNTAGGGAPLMWQRLCKALEAEHLLKRPEYASGELRSKYRERLNREISEITCHRTRKQWLERFEACGVAAGPIYRMDEVFTDPQVQHLGIAAPVEHPQLGRIRLVGQPFSLSRTPSEIRSATPERGEHTDQVLGALGYTTEQIADLRRRVVV